MHGRVKLEVEVEEEELLVVSAYCWDGQMPADSELVVADPEPVAAGRGGLAAGSLVDEFEQIEQHQQLHWTAAGAVSAVAEGHQGNISASCSCHGNVAGGGVGAEGGLSAGKDRSPHLPCTSKRSVVWSTDIACCVCCACCVTLGSSLCCSCTAELG